jgi:2-polyprenyl-3-methyl-5-hydroxy-6-metoxy-1,4-benzoquinol methylase
MLTGYGYQEAVGCDMRQYELTEQRGIKFFKCHLPRITTRRKFNVVTCMEVLEHLYPSWDNIDTLFKNIHDVLKSQGKLVITTPNLSRFRNILKLTLGRSIYEPLENYQGENPCGKTPHLREYTEKEVIRMAEPYFNLNGCFTKGDQMYFIFQKK